MSGLLDWAIFQRVFGYGTIRSQQVLEAVGHPAALLELPEDRLASLGELKPREVAALRTRATLQRECEGYLEKAFRMDCAVLTPDSDRYPAALRDIYAPPAVLYLLGNLGDLDSRPAIAMVGTRKFTDYGKQVTQDISLGLAQRGISIVSGLAAGIDAISHRAALQAGGHTIAVLGCGPDIIYPKSNTDLHGDILRAGGAILTEYPPGETPLAYHFPVRNRIVAGLSLGVVVVEGGRHSGSLITAGHAVTQGREVFAVPGSIYSPMSAATNWLITQGATMATCVEDILEQFPYIHFEEPRLCEAEQISFDIPVAGVYNDTVPAYLNENQRAVLVAIAAEPVDADELLQRTNIGLPAILASLTQLELFGLIEAAAGRRFKRK